VPWQAPQRVGTDIAEEKDAGAITNRPSRKPRCRSLFSTNNQKPIGFRVELCKLVVEPQGKAKLGIAYPKVDNKARVNSSNRIPLVQNGPRRYRIRLRPRTTRARMRWRFSLSYTRRSSMDRAAIIEPEDHRRPQGKSVVVTRGQTRVASLSPVNADKASA